MKTLSSNCFLFGIRTSWQKVHARHFAFLFQFCHSYLCDSQSVGTGISQAAGRNRPLPKSKSKKAKQEEIEVIRANVEDEELLLKVQVKILKVIGSFAHVIDLEENYKSVDIGIEQNYNVLKFKIPFGRDGFEIYLGNNYQFFYFGIKLII